MKYNNRPSFDSRNRMGNIARKFPDIAGNFGEYVGCGRFVC